MSRHTDMLIEILQLRAENLRLTKRLAQMDDLAREMYYQFRFVACGARSAIDQSCR